ncbi:hypothetical protein BH23ACT5_BH23ACT5_04300 [soil metagenome]
MRVEQGPGFPSGPFVIAANHHSLLDSVIVGAVFGRHAAFLALSDLFVNYRLLDWALRQFGVIPVGRSVVPLGAVRAAMDHLAEGGVVGIFPEGTRVVRFGDVPVRRGAAWLAARSGVPLVPVALIGTGVVLGLDNRLQRGRVRVGVGPALTAAGAGTGDIEDLRRRWQEWMVSVLTP